MSKIVLFGQAAFGKAVLEGLLSQGHEITAVCTPEEKAGKAVDPLAVAAREAGLRLVSRKSYKGEDAFAEVNPGCADLGVLAFVTQIIPLAMVDAPGSASICFHPSLLPAYQGGSAIAWQLINGETRGGVTLFRPDAGMDTGPIYLCKELEIGPDDSAGSYYYGKVFETGVAATLEAAAMALDGVVPEPQDPALASYQPLCRDRHAGVDWSRPAAELHNLVRGCDPSPGAHCRFAGQVLRLYGSRRAQDLVSQAPGTVLSLSDQGLEVAAAGGSLLFKKLKAQGGKGPAAEIADFLGIAPGDVLDSCDTHDELS